MELQTARRRPTTCRRAPGGGGFWIGGWQPERSRYIKTSMSYVTGSHNFKAGVEHRWGNDQPRAADGQRHRRALLLLQRGRHPDRRPWCWPLRSAAGSARPGHYGGRHRLRHGRVRAGLVDGRQVDPEPRRTRPTSSARGCHRNMRTGGHVGAGTQPPGLPRPALEHRSWDASAWRTTCSGTGEPRSRGRHAPLHILRNRRGSR